MLIKHIYQHVFIKMSLVFCENQSSRVFDQVWHKLGCAVKEDGERLEISDLGSRGIVLYM